MLTKKLEPNQRLIVHLTNAMSTGTQLEVHYSPKMDACLDVDFAPVVRSGMNLILSPINTPLVLELAGQYRFEPLASDTEARIHTTAVDSSLVYGDIMGRSAYGGEVG